MMTLRQFLDAIAPKLSQDEEVFAIGLTGVAEEFFGSDVVRDFRGKSVLSTESAQLLFGAAQ